MRGEPIGGAAGAPVLPVPQPPAGCRPGACRLASAGEHPACALPVAPAGWLEAWPCEDGDALRARSIGPTSRLQYWQLFPQPGVSGGTWANVQGAALPLVVGCWRRGGMPASSSARGHVRPPAFTLNTSRQASTLHPQPSPPHPAAPPAQNDGRATLYGFGAPKAAASASCPRFLAVDTACGATAADVKLVEATDQKWVLEGTSQPGRVYIRNAVSAPVGCSGTRCSVGGAPCSAAAGVGIGARVSGGAAQRRTLDACVAPAGLGSNRAELPESPPRCPVRRACRRLWRQPAHASTWALAAPTAARRRRGCGLRTTPQRTRSGSFTRCRLCPGLPSITHSAALAWQRWQARCLPGCLPRYLACPPVRCRRRRCCRAPTKLRSDATRNAPCCPCAVPPGVPWAPDHCEHQNPGRRRAVAQCAIPQRRW